MTRGRANYPRGKKRGRAKMPNVQVSDTEAEIVCRVRLTVSQEIAYIYLGRVVKQGEAGINQAIFDAGLAALFGAASEGHTIDLREGLTRLEAAIPSQSSGRFSDLPY